MANNKYKYRALNKDQKTVIGIVEATNKNIAIDVLTDKGLSIVSIKKEKIFDLNSVLVFLNRVSIKDLVIFARQLSVLVSASLPLIKALQVLKEQTDNPYFQKIISEIIDDVDGGVKLSKAFAKYPNVFNEFYVSMVESGETSGKLEEVLVYLADQQEKDYDLKSKIKGAMIYPAFIASGLGTVGIVMMVFVVPKLTAILQESGGELPFSTRLLIWMSDTLKNQWWLLIILAIGAFVGFKMYTRTSFGKRQWDYFKLKMPIFGSLFQKIAIVRFTRGFSTLIVGGVTISKSLEIVAKIVGNEIYRELILETITAVEGGKSIATVFEQSKIVPKMVGQLMVMGEETGKLDEIFSKISDFYAREVDNMVSNLVTIIEPLIMVIMGLAVGVLVSAIILPMYQMASQF
ncbi:type II secretion system F family protein [Patescibacteria group bacterium]